MDSIIQQLGNYPTTTTTSKTQAKRITTLAEKKKKNVSAVDENFSRCSTPGIIAEFAAVATAVVTLLSTHIGW